LNTAPPDLVEFLQFANDVASAVRDLRDEAGIYTTVARHFRQSRQYDICILLLDEDENKLTVAATSAPGGASGQIGLREAGVLRQVAIDGRTAQVSDGRRFGDTLLAARLCRESGHCILTPLRLHGANAGALSVSFSHPPNGFEPAVMGLAEHIAVTVESARDHAHHEYVLEQLRRTEERSRVISETISDFVYALRAEPDGTLKREWTAGDIKRITGYTLEEMDARGGVMSIVHPDDRAIVMRRAFALVSKQPYTSEYRIIDKSGRVRWIRYYTHPLSEEGEIAGTRIYGAAQDITQAKESEQALRASEEKYRNLVESISEVIYEIDENGLVSYVSPAVEALLGYQPQEVEGRHLREFVAQEDTLRILRAFRNILSGAGAGGEYRVRAKSGETRWVQTTTQPIYQGERWGGVRGVLVDVTDRMRADQELRAYRDHLEHLVEQRTAQLRSAYDRLALLSRELMHAQEAERRHIARELHDEIGQGLTALRMSLQAARQAHSVPVPQMEDAIRIAEHALHQVRDLSLDLRPSLLDDLGLVPALRWYLDRQAQRAGLSIDFEASIPDERLPADVEVACFRFVQEALTNVARHAQARRVQVRVRRRDRGLALEVADDGIGFDVAGTLEDAVAGGSMGLLGMRERVQLAGGQMEIESRQGSGTLIRARFPLAPFSPPTRSADEAQA
jgi:PAS domain S-box-containing protein